MTLNILLAEDRVIQRESWTMILKKRGYAVTPARNGKEALNSMNADIGFVITDMDMGGYNGDWLISKLAERGYSVPIVVHYNFYANLQREQLPLYSGPIEIVRKGSVNQISDIVGYIEKYTGVKPTITI